MSSWVPFERRTYFNETDETVNKKTKAALAHNLTPIVQHGKALGTAPRRGIMQSWIQPDRPWRNLAADVKKSSA